MPAVTTDPTVAATRARLREQMPVTERWAYFDHSAVAPLSGPARQVLADWANESALEGDTKWPEWDARVQESRKLGAKLINADTSEMTLVHSTTEGINLVAEGLDWQEGDNVVVPADEFPSNLYPWMQQAYRGVETRMVPTENGRIDLDALRDACDARTRVVSVSWVGYASGYRQNLDAIADIAHSKGALFFLDAIQGLSIYPLDVTQTPIDFLSADGHKWMLGPEGAGVAYIRQEHLERLRPLGVGWNSVVGSANFGEVKLNYKKNAGRYEGGTPNTVGQLAFGASLGLLMQQPTADLEAAILDITDYLCERLTEIGAVVVSQRERESGGHDPRSGIVSADLPGVEPTEARQRLLDAGVVTSVRGGHLRMAPHAYTSYEEVDRLIDVLKKN